MDKPPVFKSLFEQLLERTGVVVSREPLQTTKAPIQHSRLWEDVIERLVTKQA